MIRLGCLLAVEVVIVDGDPAIVLAQQAIILARQRPFLLLIEVHVAKGCANLFLQHLLLYLGHVHVEQVRFRELAFVAVQLGSEATLFLFISSHVGEDFCTLLEQRRLLRDVELLLEDA